MNRINLVRFICKFLPPIISQTIRSKIISIQKIDNKEVEFKRRAFTGGILIGTTKDFHAFRFYIHGYYDWKNVVLAKHFLEINKGDFIEVGANIGTETVSFAYLNQNNKVHAFEPVLSNNRYLFKIKEENNFNNLLIYNFLASDKPGVVSFKLPEEGNSGSGYITQKSSAGIENFQTVTLDEELSTIESCSAIFIDVEGFEYNVLMGGKEIIRKFQPFIILEANSFFLESRAKISVSKLHKTLKKMGYSCYIIEKMQLKKVDLKNYKDNKNWICIPKGRKKFKNKLSQAIFFNALNPVISYKIF